MLLHAWPDAVSLKVYELTYPPHRLGLASRTLLAEVPLVVPGTHDGVAAEAHPRAYEWACPAAAALPAHTARAGGGGGINQGEGGHEGDLEVDEGVARLEPLQVVAPTGALPRSCNWDRYRAGLGSGRWFVNC